MSQLSIVRYEKSVAVGDACCADQGVGCLERHLFARNESPAQSASGPRHITVNIEHLEMTVQDGEEIELRIVARVAVGEMNMGKKLGDDDSADIELDPTVERSAKNRVEAVRPRLRGRIANVVLGATGIVSYVSLLHPSAG